MNIQRIKAGFKDLYEILMDDLPHEEIQHIMKTTSHTTLRKEIDDDFEVKFADVPVRRALMIGFVWCVYQFMQYKIWRYKMKYPEYLL